MDRKFNCLKCKRNYKSYQSLWNHNKKFHFNSLQNISQNISQNKPDIIQNKPNISQNNSHLKIFKIEEEIEEINDSKKYICKYCSKNFVFNQSKWKHEQKCKNKIHINKITELEEENKKLRQIEDNMQQQMNELRKQLLDLMNKKCKVHHKTYQKIKNNGNIIGTNNTNNNINYNIVNFGSEKVSELLTDKEKLEILKHKARAIYKCIEMVHFNEKFPQWKNVVIKNNRTNDALLFDTELNSFKLVNKEELITDIIEYRTCDIEEFFEEFKDKLDEINIRVIDKFLEDRGDLEHIRNEVKKILYNNRHKIEHNLN
jgi:hypothetical protein